MRTTRKTLLALGLLGAVAVTGCESGSASGPEHPASTVKASKQTATSKADDQGQEDDDTTLTVALDATATWRNGVTAKLSAFTRGKSGEYAAPENKDILGFTITVKNGTKKPLDLSLFDLSCTNGDDEVFDSDAGFTGAPDNHVLPGKSGSWKTACVFAATEHKVQLELTPYDESGGTYRTAIFNGTAK